MIHEILHFNYNSKTSTLTQASKEGVQSLCNCIEDCRIERKGIADNVAANMSKLLSGIRQYAFNKYSPEQRDEMKAGKHSIGYIIKLAANRAYGIVNSQADDVIDNYAYKSVSISQWLK